MSLRSISLVAITGLILGCGCASPARSDEPTTAKDKQLRDAEGSGTASGTGTKWKRWRYTGERNDCFFVVSGRCFKTESSACAAARCGKQACETTGGGPVTVQCAK
jgi:hypothetical protein